jgi:hypothetical protein
VKIMIELRFIVRRYSRVHDVYVPACVSIEFNSIEDAQAMQDVIQGYIDETEGWAEHTKSARHQEWLTKYPQVDGYVSRMVGIYRITEEPVG